MEKHSYGIDVSSKDFKVVYALRTKDDTIKFSKTKTFRNNTTGISEFINHIKSEFSDYSSVNFVMEATGVYHQELAYALYAENCKVYTITPSKMKVYLKSHTSSKTDSIDAKGIAYYGLERASGSWKPEKPIYLKLRSLQRERVKITDHKSDLKKELHALKRDKHARSTTIKRLEETIKHLEEQHNEVLKEIAEFIKEESELAKKIKICSSIKGVGLFTAIAIIAEYKGFENFSNIKQVESYAGYDVKHKSSGQFLGKSRISKEGNKHIRKAMYMPALSTLRKNGIYHNYKERMLSKGKHNKVINVAAQRKLVGLMFTLCKKQEVFIQDYSNKKSGATK